mmetsp:Transcript_85401/g.265506  ORF Transcript_85401/g.265506 Transcript_85401/m.265506 type:complete len:206 (+) Transcript_85401:436-1053(+)
MGSTASTAFIFGHGAVKTLKAGVRRCWSRRSSPSARTRTSCTSASRSCRCCCSRLACCWGCRSSSGLNISDRGRRRRGGLPHLSGRYSPSGATRVPPAPRRERRAPPRRAGCAAPQSSWARTGHAVPWPARTGSSWWRMPASGGRRPWASLRTLPTGSLQRRSGCAPSPWHGSSTTSCSGTASRPRACRWRTWSATSARKRTTSS